MINANDLRKGNWVHYYGGSSHGIILGMKFSEFSDSNNISVSIEPPNASGWAGTDLEDLTPIPLTEKILLKFGFKLENQWKEQKLYSIGAFSLVVENNKFEFEHTSTFIKDVHHLQNLYYSLFLKELTCDGLF